MKYLKILLFLLTIAGAVSAQLDTNSEHYYLYIYFYNAQQEAGARIAFSTDAVHWQLYNKEAPVIVPKIAKGETPLMRDPNVYYEKKTGIFHLTWTTAWNQDNVGYATSKDLIHWSDQTMIPVGQQIDGCKCCWAPEFIYDSLKDSVMLYWSTDRGRVGKEAFYSMTKDFVNYTRPQVYFAPKNADGNGFSVIDETILKIAPNKYYLFFKDERESTDANHLAKNVHFVFGPTPQGPWWVGPLDDMSMWISPTGCEGPTSIIIGDEVRVYFDPYNTPTSTDRSRVIKLANLTSESAPAVSLFTAGPVMKTTDGANFLPSHGSISEVPRAIVMQALYPNSSKPTDTAKVYPMGKQNMGCGTGVGLAFIPPIVIRGRALYRRRKQKKVKAK